MAKQVNTRKKLRKRQKLETIQKFLIKNADSIQRLATAHHKEFLGKQAFRTEVLRKYQSYHNIIVKELANSIIGSKSKNQKLFQRLGEELAHEAVQDGLTIEETLDGTLFLKQAIWKKLEEDGIFNLTTKEYHEVNLLIGNYCDVVASKIAITFHKQRLYIEGNLQYLAEASQILSSSLDFQTTLNNVAMLAVPHIADWCSVDLMDPIGEVKQVAIAHKDPKKIQWAKNLRKKQPVNMSQNTGLPKVLKTGEYELYPEISDAMLKAVTKSEKEYRLAKRIGFTSAMIVPIMSHEKPIGAITFVTTEIKRHYTPADLLMAQELATRASVAIENAKLFQGTQEAIGMRDDFISVASHELKTPVTSVKIFAQILKKHSEQIGDTKAVNHLTKMDRQIDKLTELIYDLLNVSKIQAGRLEFREELFDFDKAVREVVDILQQSESKHKIIIKGKTSKKIRGDQERLGQVINNLVSNAIKYSPKANKVVIHLSSNSRTITAAVQDFGIGMHKEHLERIFERFYRVYGTTDKTFPGLGIGLYISAEIVRRHGGKLWVDSEVGKGSTFYFSLPVNGKKSNKK